MVAEVLVVVSKTASKQQKNCSKDKESVELRAEYSNLQSRYNALFQLNQLSQECTDLSEFFPQVHQVIAQLMTAKNFYIAMYDQTLATIEFVYHVDGRR